MAIEEHSSVIEFAASAQDRKDWDGIYRNFVPMLSTASVMIPYNLGGND